MTPSSPQSEVTDPPDEWRRGDPDAIERLIPLVCRELRAIAAGNPARERQAITLQTTDLVHELFLRLFPRTAIR